LVYDNVLIVETPGAEVLGDSVEAVISVPCVLRLTVVDEWVPYGDGFVATDTLSVVPSDEDEAADLGVAVITVTDVLILIFVE
jgi:uncharacterized oligopeptide transporter (OPT) family protein